MCLFAYKMCLFAYKMCLFAYKMCLFAYKMCFFDHLNTCFYWVSQAPKVFKAFKVFKQ